MKATLNLHLIDNLRTNVITIIDNNTIISKVEKNFILYQKLYLYHYVILMLLLRLVMKYITHMF